MRERAWLATAIGLVALLTACTGAGTGGDRPSHGSTPAPALAVMQDEMPVGEVGIRYPTFALGASGGAWPYRWSVGSGALPAGLTLSPDGLLSGVPTAAGAFTFNVVVSDLTGKTAADSCTIKIASGLVVTLRRTGNVIVESGTAGDAFAQLSGGLGPYTYRLTSGGLPAGTSLQNLGLDGTFDRPGTYSFGVTVTDALGASASVKATYVVFAPLAFAATFNPYCSGTLAGGCSTSVPFSGGYPGTTPMLSWYAANYVTGQRVQCIDPYSGQCPVAVILKGQAVQVAVAPQSPRIPGPTGWTGQIVITLTDPVTREGTRPARIYVSVTFGY